MKNILLGNTGISVSRLGAGVLPMGPNQRNMAVEEGAAVVRHALDAGINFIDTAQYYRAYPYIRQALAGRNDDVVICSKSLAPDHEGMAAAIEEARRSLDRDVIEIFLLHEVRAGQFEQRQGAWDCLCDAREKGIVKAVGISTHDCDVTALMAQESQCDVVFTLINYAGLGIRKGDGPATPAEMERAISACHRSGKGVFSMKAFGGGNLTAQYQKALGYVLGVKDIDSVMIGFSGIKEVDEAVAFLEGKMPAGYVPDISQKKMWIEEDSCEGCGNCMRVCQSQAIFYNERGLAAIDSSRCLTCGYCAPACPVRAIILI